MSFTTSLMKGHYLLNFKYKKQYIIKPIYAKGSSWFPIIDFINFLYTHFMYITTGHAPIREYYQRFFSQLPASYPCGEAAVQTYEYIVMKCKIHDPSTCLCNIVINSFVHFLVENPAAFSFDNG